MEASARGASEAGGRVVAVMPGRGRDDSTPNTYTDLAIYTGMGDGRNIINVLSSDVIIAIEGGWGTLSEIALARKNGREVILLRSWEMNHPTRSVEGLHTVSTAEEAVSLAQELMIREE